MSFQVTVELDSKLIRDAFINGLETTQWCRCPDYDYRRIEAWWENPEEPLQLQDAYEEDQPYELTPKKVRRGVKLMAEKYSHHFGDLVRENYDAITSDVLIQLCLFGEVMYG